MTDLVERLRQEHADRFPDVPIHSIWREAADEIERLRDVLKIIWVAYQDNDGIRKIFLKAGLRHD